MKAKTTKREFLNWYFNCNLKSGERSFINKSSLEEWVDIINEQNEDEINYSDDVIEDWLMSNHDEVIERDIQISPCLNEQQPIDITINIVDDRFEELYDTNNLNFTFYAVDMPPVVEWYNMLSNMD